MVDDKLCVACGMTCRGRARYKLRDGDGYYHRRCPSDEDTARHATTDASRDESDGVGWSVDVRGTGRARSGRRMTPRVSASEARGTRDGRAGAQDGRAGGAVVAFRAFVGELRAALERRVMSFDANAPAVRRAMAAASAAYVAAAALYALPSSLASAFSALAVALRAALTALIVVFVIGVVVFVVARRVTSDGIDGLATRLAEASRTATRLAVDVVAAARSGTIDASPRTPILAAAAMRHVDFSAPSSPETPRATGSAPSPSPRESADAETIRRLLEQKRETEAMLEEASVTIEFLRDALQAADTARSSDRRRVEDLERRLARETRNVQSLSRRVAARENDLADVEPWMLSS